MLAIVILQRIVGKYIYFVTGDGGSGVALQGDRGSSRRRGMKGSVGSQGPAGKRGVEGPGGPPGKIGKWAKKVTRETLAVLVNKDMYGLEVVQVQEMCEVLKGYMESLVFKVPLECNDLLAQLAYKASVDQKGTMVLKVLLRNKVIVVNEVGVVNEEKRAFDVILQMF